MSLIKLGEAITISATDIQSPEMVFADPEILSRFEKIASDLKSIAPKAKDFLYFSAVMMHAAEASLLDIDGGFKKDSSGQEVKASWEKKGDSWVWKCSDSNLKPYKNSNNDIFPEEELIKAYKRWVGRPLCLDHKSSSVDMIRGLIIDTYYDRPNKRVVALCALDKVNYPDLARKVATGYATSVSMGTAVGRAICFDCGNVARVESDFCDHMRNKSCYGEINIDLNPIELSIVVNGADPKAKIRHIVAATDNIARYIEMKQKQLSKVAQESEMIDESKHIEMATEIGDGLDGVASKIEELKAEVDALRRGEEAEKDHEHQKAPEGQSVDDQKQVSESAKLANTLSGIHQSLKDLKQDFNKLYQKQGEDKNMTSKKTAYYQGGGDVNEPTPGKPKYEKEDSDSIRNNQDKQMESPQDVGSVDGMFPGDEQKKKELNRAASEQEKRALLRQAALQKAKEQSAVRKESWFQGGGGDNEPTPGKPKYPKEEAEKTREKEDKQMVGAPPFPGVGKIDGLYSDDQKKKEMLSRAKLTAKFVRVAHSDGSDNLADSCWQIYADKKLVLSASVKELSGGRVDALFDTIHSKDFGLKILSKIRTEGFDKAAALYKGAQVTPPAAGPAPTAPPMDMGAAPMDMEAPKDSPVDGGGTGDPKEELPQLLEEASNVLADIQEGVGALLNNPGNDLDELGDMGGQPGAAQMPVAASAVTMHKKLSHALTLGMKQAAKELESHVEELRLAKHIYENENMVKKSDSSFVKELVKEACDDARHTIADSYRLMEAFVKYARGTEILVKHAANGRKLMKTAQGLPGDPLDGTLPMGPKPPARPATTKSPVAKPKPIAPPRKSPNDMSFDELVAKRGPTPARDQMLGAGTAGQMGSPSESAQIIANPQTSMNVGPEVPQMSDDMSYVKDSDEDEDCNEAKDTNDVVKVDKEGTMTSDNPEEAGKAMKAMKSAQFKLNTKEGRAQLRAKLAEKGLAFSEMLGKAHSGGVTTQLDVKPTGDLAKVETLEETHKAMMDLANAPPKVRKMAEDIQKLVVAGKIDPNSDFPGLVSQGLDGDAVKYWKSYYGQAKDGGSQFASELVKEHAAQKMATEKETYKVKIARAYELAYEMSRKGMIGDDRHALNQQVSELMGFNDEGFDSMKRYVEKSAMSKQASAIPQVGMIGGGDIVIPAPESAGSSLVSEYENLFANRKY